MKNKELENQEKKVMILREKLNYRFEDLKICKNCKNCETPKSDDLEKSNCLIFTKFKLGNIRFPSMEIHMYGTCDIFQKREI